VPVNLLSTTSLATTAIIPLPPPPTQTFVVLLAIVTLTAFALLIPPMGPVLQPAVVLIVEIPLPLTGSSMFALITLELVSNAALPPSSPGPVPVMIVLRLPIVFLEPALAESVLGLALTLLAQEMILV